MHFAQRDAFELATISNTFRQLSCLERAPTKNT